MIIYLAGAKEECKSEPFSDPRNPIEHDLNLMITFETFKGKIPKPRQKFLENLRQDYVNVGGKWKWIDGYKNHYKISTLGRIKSVKRIVVNNGGKQILRSRILKTGKDGNGYATIILSKNGKVRTKSVAKLVLETFVGPRPKGFEICHRNDEKMDARLSNLYWGTPDQNRRDRAKNGLNPCGVKNGAAKLNNIKATKIRRLFQTGKCTNLTKLAKQFQVSRMCIANLVNNKTWKHLP